MSASAPLTFSGVFPIGDTDPLALPAKHIGPAIGYYVHVLGFAVSERAENRATLTRDGAIIGLIENGNDPEQASIYFAVSDVDALYAELSAKGIEPSAPHTSDHDNKSYQIFFARDPYGICFCFGQPAD